MADEKAFQFPDELEAEAAAATDKAKSKGIDVDQIAVEVVDDTPAADKNRKPLGKTPEEIVTDEEAKEYSEAVQRRFKELSHATHDERRAKESAQRERDAAADFAKKLWDENQKLKQYVSVGENTHKKVLTDSADAEVSAAKKALAAAYQSGDPDKVAEATQAMNQASIRSALAQNFQPSPAPSGQDQKFPLQFAQSQQALPSVDERAVRWQARNQWFGTDDELTSFALGFHKKLVASGVDPTSDEYYRKVDARMREKFPEVFNTNGSSASQSEPTTTQAKSVVAPVGRSSGPRKVTLSISEQNLARRLGITPEQYARQKVLLEKQNG